VEEIHTVVHILKKEHLRPHNDKTPYELWFGRPASIKHFNVFGNNVILRIMMKILENMMKGMMKVSSWVMLQIVKGTYVKIRDFIN
jgi:hypothetical protein